MSLFRTRGCCRLVPFRHAFTQRSQYVRQLVDDVREDEETELRWLEEGAPPPPKAAGSDDVLEQGHAVLYHDKTCDTVVKVTVLMVHRDEVPPYYRMRIRLASGQERETERELLWREGEVPPGAPADEAQQARACILLVCPHLSVPHRRSPPGNRQHRGPHRGRCLATSECPEIGLGAVVPALPPVQNAGSECVSRSGDRGVEQVH